MVDKAMAPVWNRPRVCSRILPVISGTRWTRKIALPSRRGGVGAPAEFTRLAEKVEHDQSLKPEERSKFLRQFSSMAQLVTGDKQGRIVLPDEQCKVLKLRDEVVLVGNYLRFEIWDPGKWEKTKAEDEQTFNYLLERIGI
jgi:MraZ protein